VPVPVESLRRAVRVEDSLLVFEVAVRPEASTRDRLLLEEGELVFETPEPPLRGRPEAALKRFLVNALNVNPGLVEVEAPPGAGRRIVRVRLEGVDEEAVLERLASAVEPAA